MEGSFSQSMARPWHAYLQAAAVLTGDRDKEYGIERARPGREAIAAPLQRRLEVWNSLAAALPALPPKPALPGTSKVDEAQHLTGAHALACVVAVHEALVDAPRPADDAPLLGARDLALLKRLVALAFAWYVVPAIDAFDAEASASLLQVHDNGTSPALGVLQQVSQTLQSLLTEASPSHASALPTTALARTDVATLVVRTYLSDLFRVWMRVAYADPPSTDAQRMLERVLRLSPTRSALGALRSVPMPSALSQAQVRPPPFVREHVARLLSLQLLRPDGVRAFLQAMLGEQDSDLMASDVGDDVAEGDALFQRLDGVAKVLSTPPKHMARAEYYEAMAPQLLDLIDPVPPPGTTPVPGTHRRAAAFVLERMYQRNAAATAHMLTTLVHQPFAPRDAQATPPAPDAVDRALRRLTAMVTLAPPAPDWVHAACAPVSDRLLSLDSFVHQPATTGISDVTASRARSEQAADTHAVLHTWLRLGPEDEVRASLSRALSNVLDDEWDWTHTPNGVACVVRDTEPAPLDHIGQHILSLDQVKKSMDGENDEPVVLPSDLASSLHFPLDPARLAVLLKGAQRVSLGSSLLLVAMDEYRRVQGAAVSGLTESSSGALERRSVFFLQIVFQLFDTFGKSLMEGDTDKVLQFIDFACATRATADIFESALINAALQLLLALLEGSPTLTLSNTPLLRVIAEHVDKCRDAPDSETRALSQEAAVALRARESMLPTSNANSSNRPAYVDVYQEALRYLQDPILPVRAHGLHLLTQLVATDTRRHPVCYGTVVPDALLPAIFDLLVDAIQDDESFLYLNAVQGLAEMASSHREAVLGPLLAIYVGGDKTKDRMAHALTYGQQLTPREIDQRLRLGEALLQVLQHLGDAAVVECTYAN